MLFGEAVRKTNLLLFEELASVIRTSTATAALFGALRCTKRKLLCLRLIENAGSEPACDAILGLDDKHNEED
jgi:hypothetical protein